MKIKLTQPNDVVQIEKSDGTIIDLLNLEYYKTINITLEDGDSDIQFSDFSKQQVSLKLGISESEVDAIYNGRCDRIAYTLNSTDTVTVVHTLSYLGGNVNSTSNSGHAIYGYYIQDGNIDAGEVIYADYGNNKYSLTLSEL